MSIPITLDDFVAIGERYLSEEIVNEADRLLPIATADIDLLATRGYGQGELNKLQGFRATLVAEAAGRNQQRGSKKGSRSVEAQAIKEGKLVLRSGETTALAVLATLAACNLDNAFSTAAARWIAEASAESVASDASRTAIADGVKRAEAEQA